MLAGRVLLCGPAIGCPAAAVADALFEAGEGAWAVWLGAEFNICDGGLAARWGDGRVIDISCLALAVVTAAAGIAHGEA